MLDIVENLIESREYKHSLTIDMVSRNIALSDCYGPENPENQGEGIRISLFLGIPVLVGL